MANKDERSGDIAIAPININDESQKNRSDADSLLGKNEKKKGRSGRAFATFLYNPKKRTVLGRDGLNWGK